MLSEILNRYENFSDALISEIMYRAVDNIRTVEIVINCMNALNDYKYEKIRLMFTDVVSVNFNESNNQSSTFVNSAFLVKDDGIIVVDFFPLLYSGGNLKEDLNSDLKIKCRKLSYVLIG